MGLLTFLSGVSGAAKSMPKIVSGIANGLDALHFSQEERAGVITGITKTVVDYAKQTINESSVRSMTRRVLALMFCGSFLYLLLFSAMAWRWNTEWAIHTFNCAKQLVNPVIAIIIFFFGSYGVGYFLDKKKK